jgi:hypothetical protein
MNKISSYIKYPLFVLIIVSLFLPKPAFAFFGTGLFDFFNHLMDGVGERTGPMFQYVLSGLILYAVAIFSLFISSRILENFITAQGDWIASLNDVTQAGWDFVAGLSNMLLIVILIIIAFAFIFKIETFQAKKALPRLIGVALLINFSLLFVKMLVDIFQVLYNTVLPDESLFTLVIDTLIGPSSAVISTVAGWLLAAGIAWSIPFANAFAQIAFSAALTVLILPNIIMWAIQAVFSYILAGMFFFFILLFGARVFVLTLLMILSPLAFVCLILPQTKSFWSKWFKTLLEWLLLGVYFLFFLYLGFSAIEVLAPEGLTVAGVDVSLLPLGSFGSIGGYIIYYLGVFIYMAVILMIGKQFIPQGAQAMIDFGKGIAGTVLTRGLMPIGKGAVAQIREGAIKQRMRQEQIDKGATMTRLERIARPTMGWMEKPVRFAHRLAGTTPEIEKTKELNQKVATQKKKYEEADSKDLAELFGKNLTYAARLAIASLLASRGDFNDLKTDSEDKRDIAHKDALEHSPRILAKEFRRSDPTAVFRTGGEVEQYYRSLGKTVKEALEDLKIRPKDIENLNDADLYKDPNDKTKGLNDEFLGHLAKLNPEHWSKLSDNSKVFEGTHREIAKYLASRTTDEAINKDNSLDSSLLRAFVSRPNLSRYIVPEFDTMDKIKDYEQKKSGGVEKPKQTGETKLYGPKGEKLL